MSIVYKRDKIPMTFAVVAALDPNVWVQLVAISPALADHNDDPVSVKHAIRRALTTLVERQFPASWSFGCVRVPDQHGQMMRVFGILVSHIGMLYIPAIHISDFLQDRGILSADHCASFGGTWMWAESVTIEGPRDGVEKGAPALREHGCGTVRNSPYVLWSYVRSKRGCSVCEAFVRKEKAELAGDCYLNGHDLSTSVRGRSN